MKKFVLFSGTSNLPLARKIAKYLKVRLGKIAIERFADGETYVNIEEEVKNKIVIVLQSGSEPGNEHLVELLLIIDALKRLKTRKIIAILPFYPYRRQEKKVSQGEPVSAELVAHLLERTGVSGIITLDLHSPKIRGFFKIPLIELEALPLFVQYFKLLLQKSNQKDWLVVAPDRGAFPESQKFARLLGLSVGLIEKSRLGTHDVVKRMYLSGNVKNKNVIILDDEISTAGTLIMGSQLLKARGAKEIFVAVTHLVLAGLATQRLKKAPIKELIVTDTIFLAPVKKLKKIKVLSVAEILAEAIKAII